MTEKQLPFDTKDFANILGKVPSPVPSVVDGQALASARELPDISVIDHANLSEQTKYKYKRELQRLFDQDIDPLNDFQSLIEYAKNLKSSRKAFLKSALRLLSIGYKNELQAKVTSKNLAIVDAAVHRIDAMQKTISYEIPKHKKTQFWLSPTQVQEITSLCGDDLEGKRDWIILGLLLGAGLQREELVATTFDALKQQFTEYGNIRDVLEVNGKGAKERVIPISSFLAKRLREWRDLTGGGLVARSLGMKKELGNGMSAVAVFQVVRKYGKMIDIPELSPKDLRRTYTRLAFDAGVPITQIKELLGHASLATTQRYLDFHQDFDKGFRDFIPLSGD